MSDDITPTHTPTIPTTTALYGLTTQDMDWLVDAICYYCEHLEKLKSKKDRVHFQRRKVQILYADEFERPDFNEMIQKVCELYMKYNFDGSGR